MITPLGEERAGLCASRAFVYFARVDFFSFFSSSWCQGLAGACDCGTPWTFLLTVWRIRAVKSMSIVYLTFLNPH